MFPVFVPKEKHIEAMELLVKHHINAQPDSGYNDRLRLVGYLVGRHGITEAEAERRISQGARKAKASPHHYSIETWEELSKAYNKLP